MCHKYSFSLSKFLFPSPCLPSRSLRHGRQVFLFFTRRSMRRLVLCCAGGLFLPFVSSSQSDKFRYDKDQLTKEFHAGRRDALRALMPDSSVAVFFASPELIRSNDVEYQYCQSPDFYYLTGCPEPNAVVLIFKEKVKLDSLYTNEVLFVQERNASKESWTGRRLGVEGARRLLGFKQVLLNGQFEVFDPVFQRFKVIYATSKPVETGKKKSWKETDTESLKRRFAALVPEGKQVETEALKGWMADLRVVKTAEELVLLKKAIRITCEAHAELMRGLDSTMTEFQAQALVEYGFKVRGSEYPGYPSIVGSGENTCILHYTENRKPLHPGDLIVVDAGAEYHGYTADVTRTLPANGLFSKEQRLLYDAVYDAQAAGIAACMAGNDFHAPHMAAFKVVAARLKELGIIQNELEATRYFFHGTSHYLGLDVHDVGPYGKLKPGNVITVEPGIYIPEGAACDKKWWNTGIRIEDDILITESAPENLSGSLPSKAGEVERIMKENSFFKVPSTEK